MKYTGGEMIAEYLIREGIEYVIGIPGHGCLGIVDALRKRKDELKVIQVRHEQSAVHMADGYYRTTGKPLAVFTSIGPGAINTVEGLATAFSDSTAVLAITGDVHTHMFGKGVLQEIERNHWANFPRIVEPVVKRYWQVNKAGQLPGVLHRAFNNMLTGRPGPVLIDVPMDVQCDSADVQMPEPLTRKPQGKWYPDDEDILKAAKMLYNAKRPVILAGGGISSSGAFDELKSVVEYVGGAVVTTVMGKGCFPETHPLYGWHCGSKGTTCGNALTQSADVILAIGCRFVDQTTSSFKAGVSFEIPPSKLIHVDIDPTEIGKNYPVDIGITGDARAVLEKFLTALENIGPKRDYVNSEYFKEIQDLKEKWFSSLSEIRDTDRVPVTISRLIKELQTILSKDTIIVTSSGNTQAQVFQEYAFEKPKTHITTGGFSTMGFTLPAALGVKLANPDKPVVGIVGDGDILMTIQELATAVQYDIPILLVVANNISWQAIKDLQIAVFGQDSPYAVDFQKEDGMDYTPEFSEIAKAFGAYGVRVQHPCEIKDAVNKGLSAGKPAVIEVMTNREYPYSGGINTGWWDVPIPTYMNDKRAKYEHEMSSENLT